MKFDQAFLEQIVLLVLTALITGFGIPIILRRIDEAKIRQGKIIEAQSKLLDDLSQLLWKWRYMAKQVVYYGANGNRELYARARNEYNESIWLILHEFRVEISKARRLVSEKAYERLNGLYDYIVGDLDQKISAIIGAEKPDSLSCAAMASRFSNEVTKALDDALND
jgi:hypothetical protein